MTDQWYVQYAETSESVIIARVENDIPICQMAIDPHGMMLTKGDAINIALSIVDTWNSTCSDYGELM